MPETKYNQLSFLRHSMSQYDRNYLKDRPWSYLGLKVVFDSDVTENDARQQYFELLSLDKLTWKSILSAALRKLYGITGEARHFDILDTRCRFSLIRINADDKDIFINSISAFTFSLNKYAGSLEHDVDCRIQIETQSDFLGLASADAHYDI